MEALLLAGAGVMILALGFIHYELQLLIRVMAHQDPRARVEPPSRFFPWFFAVIGLIMLAYGLFNGVMSIIRAPGA